MLRSKQIQTLLSFDKLPTRQILDYRTRIDSLIQEEDLRTSDSEKEDDETPAVVTLEISSPEINVANIDENIVSTPHEQIASLGDDQTKVTQLRQVSSTVS